MKAGRPKEYKNRVQITSNIEQDLLDIGREYFKIRACEAITTGFIGKIDSFIDTNIEQVDPDILDLYFSIRNRIIKDRSEEYRTKQKEAKKASLFTGEVDKAIREASETESERREREEKARATKLKVYDRGDDTRKIITMEKYLNDPDSYEVLKPPVQEDEEDNS